MNNKTKLTRRSLMSTVGTAGVAATLGTALLGQAGAQTVSGTKAVALAVTDALWWMFGRRAAPERPLPNGRGSERELAGGSAWPTSV